MIFGFGVKVSVIPGITYPHFWPKITPILIPQPPQNYRAGKSFFYPQCGGLEWGFPWRDMHRQKKVLKRGMIMKNLYLIGKASVDLHKMIKELPDADFPHWWQSKVVKAQNYLDGARNYLDAELNAPRGDYPEIEDKPEVDDDPSGVS